MSETQATESKKEKKTPIEALKDRLTRLIEGANKIVEETANWQGDAFVEMRKQLGETGKTLSAARDAVALAPADFQPPAKAPASPALKEADIEIGAQYMLAGGAATREAKHAASPVRLIAKVSDKQLRVLAGDGRTRLLVGYGELRKA